MSTEKFESPIEDQEPAASPAAEGEPGTDDVEGHSLLIDPTTAHMLQRAREDDMQRQAEKHRREQEAKHPLQPRGRR
jgi:hypothetical protein